MKFLMLAFAAVLLLQDDKVKESPYGPYKVGNQWTYKVNDMTIVTRISKHEKFDDKMCAVLETLKDGQSVATEHIEVREDGLYRCAYNGEKIEPPLRFLKLPAKKGDSWQIESKTQGQNVKGTFTIDEEEIQVGEQKIKAITATANEFEVEGNKMSTKYWFAENHGIVKQWFKQGATEVTLELSKFEPAK